MKLKITLALFLLPLLSLGQEPLHYWRQVDSFMIAQANKTFTLVHELLQDAPPSTAFSLKRQSALMHIDWVMHDTRLDHSAPVYQFIEDRIQHVVDDLAKPVKKGVKVYKLYNHGFVVKSKTVTIAFDLIRGANRNHPPFISSQLMEQVVAHCDVLFVSHEHGDHADREIAQMFVDKGKTVVAPPGLWDDLGRYAKHLRAETILEETITLANKEPIHIKIMPGHQDDVPNNVYLVSTPEGITVAHTGDQWNKEKDGWIDTVKDHASVDILLVHCWAMPLERMANGFDPKLIITGHENELIHSVDHREPYWLNERRMKQVKQPKVYMTWGEHYWYRK